MEWSLVTRDGTSRPCSGTHWYSQDQLGSEERGPLCCIASGVGPGKKHKGFREAHFKASRPGFKSLLLYLSNLMTPSKPHKPSGPLVPHLQMEITVLNCRAGEDQGRDSEAGMWVVATLMEKAEKGKFTFIKYLLFAGCCNMLFSRQLCNVVQN